MKKILLILAIILLLILAWFCVYKHHPEIIQQDISDRTGQALTEMGLDKQIDYRVDGRDVYLTANGMSKEQQEQTLQSIKDLWGVRVAYLEEGEALAPVNTPPVASLPSAFIDADYDGSRISLNGMVESESDIQSIINRLKGEFGSEVDIANNLNIGSDSIDMNMWRKALAQLANLSSGKLSLHKNKMRLTGMAVSDQALSSIQSQFTSLGNQYSSFDFVADLNVAESFDTATCQSRLNELIAGSTIGFASGKADIDNASLPLLNRISVASQRCDAVVHIKGHTDSQGRAAANLNLSQLRADAVKNYLTNSGVPVSRLRATGYGETQAIATNDTAAGRAQNRRIEFNVE